ncbi:MAG TPA: DUF6785 family protein [Chthonomonadales bacterium]|nr:DUF6785 family protein [Chthonomonadales bacterium]
MTDPSDRLAQPIGAAPASRPAIPWRGIAVGALLMPLNAIWLAQMEVGTSGAARTTQFTGPYPSTLSLFANVVCFVLAMVAVNALVRRVRPRWALEQAEMLVVYVMLTIGTCVQSIDFLDVLIPMMGHVTRYATPSNNWDELFGQYIPSWFHVTDPKAIEAFYVGGANPFDPRYLRAWAVPVAAWTGFILVLLGVMLCMNVILREQWTRHEKLSYPIIQLPMDMTEPDGALYRQKLLWAGFAVAGGVSVLNGLAVFYPALPSLPIKAVDISPHFPSQPWNAMGWTPVAFYPFSIGLGFLLPTDMLFSCWFFALFWRFLRVASSYFGWSDYSPQFPYVNEQSFGAYMAVALLAGWGLRRHVASVWRDAWRRGRVPQPDEPMDPRLAFAGVFLGFAALCAFFWMARLPLWMAVTAFLIYFAIALACTRMRAELGAPAHDLHNGGPDYILTAVCGTRTFTPQTLTALTWFYWFNRAYRSLAMPCQLEAFKIAERKRVSLRGMTIALVVAAVIGTLCGFLAIYTLAYREGAETRMATHFPHFGWEAYNRLNAWVASPRDRDLPAMMAVGAGAVSTYVLHFARMHLSWWPFHPLGLAISGSFTMSTLWMTMLIAWVCKIAVLRYGGLRSYRAAMPFFLGLLLGDFTIGCAWTLVGWALGTNVYSFYF